MSGKKKKPGFTLMREVGLRCHVIVYVLSIIQISVNVKTKLKYRCRNTVYGTNNIKVCSVIVNVCSACLRCKFNRNDARTRWSFFLKD